MPGGVFAAALLIRLVYLYQLRDSGLWDFLRLDPLYYRDWALRIASGEILGTATFEMTPLYAYALAAVSAVTGHDLLIPRIIQAVIGSATCAVAAMLGRRIFGRFEGLAAGLALAAYGPALFHESQIMKTVLTVALSTAAAAVLHVSEGSRPRLLAAGGLLVGATALAQENINVTIPVLLAWVVWKSGRGRRTVCCSALLAGFIAAVAPATIRNAAVSGELVLITSGGGEVFYTGTHSDSGGKYTPPPFVRPDPFYEHEDFRTEAALRLGRPVTRRESDAFWWKESLRTIAEDPGRYGVQVFQKLMTYFTDYERPDNYSFVNFREFVPLLRLPLVHFGWIAPFTILGLVFSARRWASLVPLYAVMGAYLLSALLFFTQSRYRMPTIPLFAMFAAHGAAVLVTSAMRKETRRLAWSVPLVILLAAFVNRDPGEAPGTIAQNHGILGEMFLYAEKPDEAASHFRQAIAMFEEHPDEGGMQFRRVVASCHYGLVTALEALDGERGTPTGEEAILRHLREAAKSPESDTRHDSLENLGSRMMDRGDVAAAAQAWAGAIEAEPGDFPLRLRLAEALHKSGKPLEALRVVEDGLEGVEDPVLLSDAHFGRALIHRDLGDRERMLHHLRECLRLNPDHPAAGRMLREAGG